MKIYSMTATFGKLEHQTLSLKPGLNVIHAPNEWGKSTWCAFLAAMLYGIDTRERSTQTTLADKEHYKPWSGSPMSGRMDIHWNGRDITIERSTKGRAIMGEFRAYETETGLPVAELTATNCGELLLGVEKAVFLRSSFIRLTDLPVTYDESLRRRLHALVTTGDESGASDALAQKLRDLKNNCRYNKSGLLPQAEAQKKALEEKLRELNALKELTVSLAGQQAQLEEYRKQLQNHHAALEYAANRTYVEKLAAAETAQTIAQAKAQQLQQDCSTLPSMEEIDATLLKLRQLRSDLDALHTDAQLLPHQPLQPEVPSFMKGLNREDALRHAQTDLRVYRESVRENKARPPFILGIALSVASIALLLIPHWIGICCGAAGILSGVALASTNTASRRRAGATLHALEQKYAPLSPDMWEKAAGDWADVQSTYAAQAKAYQAQRAALDQRMASLKQSTQDLTGGESLAVCEQLWMERRSKRRSLIDVENELNRATDLASALRSSHKDVPPPQQEDTLTLSEAETARQLADCSYRLQQLHTRLGQCQGQMDALGQADALQRQLAAVQARITRLEDIYQALVLAQSTLSAAADTLQRRFAPKLVKQAQTFFDKMTGGRYNRLSLGQDLSVSTGAEGEDTLHSGLWRSDGTADQLYLAVRLAVAEALTPEAPLILDDALVRFDDHRLALAMDILKDQAQAKQVILFTCQQRETRYIPADPA